MNWLSLLASLIDSLRYVGRLERGQSGVTVEALAAILAPLGQQLRSGLSLPWIAI